MINKLRITPRWIIFSLDLFFSALAITIAHMVRQSITHASYENSFLLREVIFVLIANTCIFYLLQVHTGIVRYSGAQDTLRIFIALLFSTLMLLMVNELGLLHPIGRDYSRGIIVVYGSIAVLSLLAYRFIVKYVFHYLNRNQYLKRYVAILGAGMSGITTKKVLDNDPNSRVEVEFFIDDNKNKIGKQIESKSILSFETFVSRAKKSNISELIIASYSLSAKRKNEIVDFCLSNQIKVTTIPPYHKWIDGSFNFTQVKGIQIEDLLERAPIRIDNERIHEEIRDKKILVTGAAGSIGSEIVRQLVRFQPRMLVLCDQAETPLHSLDLELQAMGMHEHTALYLADITNEKRMREVFEKFQPDFVFHAAAYKHVPMMELCPSEAIHNNVLGTQLLADLSIEYGVERFVMVSTDKAVNPTNVMGASKRLAEIYVQTLSANPACTTRFITTRFGNVLGSNGSVILRFKQQIESGEAVTITHPEIQRYFMTIPEASQLVLEAGIMGEGGEIFVFDMGKPVLIDDMARKMIRLYGYEPDRDIEIKYTGLRPGEKMFEELLSDGENLLPTHNASILIARVRTADPEMIQYAYKDLKQMIEEKQDEQCFIQKLKKLVPEYNTESSIFA